MSSCEICGVFKNTFFEKHLRNTVWRNHRQECNAEMYISEYIGMQKLQVLTSFPAFIGPFTEG